VKEIILAIILLGILPFAIISTSGVHENTGIVTVQRMCAVPMNGTAYDCSEYWAMVYYPDMGSIQGPEDKGWFSGFAVHGEYVNDGEKWSICKFFPKIRDSSEENCSIKWFAAIKWFAVGKYKQDGCWNEICLPLVWHEMKHLACECNWHENMTSESSFKNIILNGTGND